MRWTLILAAALLLISCAPHINFTRELSDSEKKFKDHIGFMLFDPSTQKALCEYNSGVYFAPASNTKIFTLYTSLHILGDSIPALKYLVRNDSLIIWGYGDPSFLNRKFADNRRVYNFLSGTPHKLFVSTANFKSTPWGPGWSWEDYNFTYATERSPFPVYGNIGTVRKIKNHFILTPRLFQNHFSPGDSVEGKASLLRDIESNQLTFSPGKKKDTTIWYFPYHYSSDALVEILSDTLKRQVDEIDYRTSPIAKTLFSLPSDSLYARMMKFSDNLIAEQLMILCAGKISDTLSTEIAIRYAKKNFFARMPDDLIWIDGSGMSRYNLFTPRTIVALWDKLYAEIPQQRLFSILSVGGQKGTLKSSYKSDPPFVFGKTGSLSNNQTLSGYLITKKKKVLIFSFMNGNFVAPEKEIRAMMENLLNKVRDNY